MRRLLLLRHAKSSWADPGARDHDRPLNPRGRHAATRMGTYLHDEGLVPDLVLCSSARRTCETVARLDLPDSVELVIEHDLYLAHPDAVVEQIRAVADAVTTLMVVGHNPTTQDLALELAGGGEPDAILRMGQKFPTGALAILAVPGRWSTVAPGIATLERFVTPRALE
jgi:phosphohistidine phosphatase